MIDVTISLESDGRVRLKETRTFHCTKVMGTWFVSWDWSDDEPGFKARVDRVNRTVTVDTASGEDRETFSFQYRLASGDHPKLVEASMVSTRYSTLEKRMIGEEWIALKGKFASVKWNCEMAVSPIYADDE